MGLSFTIPAGPRQRSDSQFWVPRDSWPYFTVSVSRLPQTGGPGPRIYIPQEEGCPVIPPGTGLPLLRLLRLAALRWTYSEPPPLSWPRILVIYPRGGPNGKHHLLTVFPLLGVVSETCFPSRCLAMDVFSGSTIPAFRRHVTILMLHYGLR
jgi:hypothetical protein